MDDISFTTFLKIGLMPTTQGKFGALNRMLNGTGGYDFYKRMKMASREVARGEMDRQEIFAQLSTIKRAAERDHNLLMAERTCAWWDTREGAEALVERPSGTYRSEGMDFGIRLQPELAYRLSGKAYVTYLWAIDRPRLTREAAGVGLFLLRAELAHGQFADAIFEIRDLRREVTFEQDCISNQSGNLLQADIAAMNAMWVGSLAKAA